MENSTPKDEKFILAFSLIGLVLLFGVKFYLTYNPTSQHTAVDTKIRAPASEIVFKYRYKGEDLKLTLQGLSWDAAHKKASDKCMDYYKDKNPQAFEKAVKGDEDEYLSIIDVCVNPREGNKPVSYENWND